MQNPFLTSAGCKFASRAEILTLARETAARMAARNSDVRRVLLFGSFARGDFSARSDIDLLIVLKSSTKSTRDRIEEFLQDCPVYPTDVFPLTELELRNRLEERDPFWTRALNEAIECYPEMGFEERRVVALNPLNPFESPARYRIPTPTARP